MAWMQKAVELVAKLLPDAPSDPSLGADRVVGQAIERVDGTAKVTGTAAFTADLPFPGLAHASLACSTVAAGRIVRIETAAAEKAPGVVLVMTHLNAPRMAQAPLLLDMKGASFTRLPVMQDDRVRWNGEPIAVVVANTKEQADAAAALIRAEYAPETARVSFDLLKAHAEPPPDVLGQPAEVRKGDVDAALAGAHAVVDRTYRTPRHSHAAIEPHVTVAEWRDGTDLLVHDASQAVSQTRATLAAVFGIDPSKVRVVSRFIGGAFGNKMVWNHQLLCIAAARLAGRPVRLQLSRADVFHTVGGRTQTAQRVVLGARADGTLAALVHEGVSTTGRKNGFAEQFTFPARHLYAADTYRIGQRVLELDTVANASMRAPGESVGTFALESALDELAHRLDLDPIELRRRIEPGTDPTKGTPFSSRHLVACYARGADMFGWRRHVPRSRREGEWWIGQGVATATYPYQRFPGGKVRIRLTDDGRATVSSAAHEMGMGTATVQAQLAAERLGLPFERVTFEYGDSDLPHGVTAGGSAQTASIAAAVAVAVASLTRKLIRVAGNDSPLAGAKPSEVEMRDGGLFRREGAAGESYASILRRANRRSVEAEGTGGMPFEMMKHSMHSYGAQFCELRVSEVTGEVRVRRWLGVFDTGRVFSPRLAAGQLRGGIVMGLGAALMEESVLDERSGRVANPSLAEYHVPVHADVPRIDVEWLGIPDPRAPMGGRGLGEIGIVGVAAAVANAVFNATGKRVTELPITPDRVLSAIAKVG